MALIGMSNEQKIWNYLKSKGFTDCGAAGLMGNLFAESGLVPNNLQNTYNKSLGMSDVQYTAAVDTGRYNNFVNDAAGYGLAQWTYWTRKKAMLAYAQKAKKSIGDLEMQLGFLIQELSTNFASVLSALKTATSVQQASNVVLFKFECPADQGTNMQIARASYGQKYYDKYATKKSTGTPAANTTSSNTGVSVQQMIDKAYSMLNHDEHPDRCDIMDWYKGFSVAINAVACCCAGMMYLFYKAGILGLIPGGKVADCGSLCRNFYKAGQLHGPKEVKPGDLVIFSWSKEKSTYWPASALGYNTLEHVEYCVAVDSNTIKCIGANNGGTECDDYQLKTRQKANISCCCRPKYSAASSGSATTTTTPATTAKKSVAAIAQEVIDGKWGNGDDRKKKLTASGYSYAAVQAKVNEILKGSTSSSTSTYTVKRGDTLYGIALNKLGSGSRYTEIMKLNGLTSSLIHPGKVLKIPRK